MFDSIEIGNQYKRQELASLWGYKSFFPIARGAVTPSHTPYIILFITYRKHSDQTQYDDYLEKGILKIDGETNHLSDNRIINAAKKGDQIHLFYREHYTLPFTYYGQIYLTEYERRLDTPSRFIFDVPFDR